MSACCYAVHANRSVVYSKGELRLDEACVPTLVEEPVCSVIINNPVNDASNGLVVSSVSEHKVGWSDSTCSMWSELMSAESLNS